MAGSHGQGRFSDIIEPSLTERFARVSAALDPREPGVTRPAARRAFMLRGVQALADGVTDPEFRLKETALNCLIELNFFAKLVPMQDDLVEPALAYVRQRGHYLAGMAARVGRDDDPELAMIRATDALRPALAVDLRTGARTDISAADIAKRIAETVGRAIVAARVPRSDPIIVSPATVPPSRAAGGPSGERSRVPGRST